MNPETLLRDLPSADALVTQLRDLHDVQTLRNLKRIQAWLDAAAIAIPAVLNAGAAGNVTCREASHRILSIL